jgi:hypothetical protein
VRSPGPNLAYASKAARLTPLERAEVERRQLKLFHVKHQRTPTDAAVDRAVKRLGLDRVLQSLDRLTRPVAEAAE